MNIRKIEIKDTVMTYKLLNELYEKNIKFEIFKNKLEKNLLDDDFYGIVAEEDDVILGVLISRRINRLVKDNYTLFIDDLIVDNKHRGKSIGTNLLNNAISFAKENNCDTVELTSVLSNIKSHKLYEMLGFKKGSYKFKLVLN